MQKRWVLQQADDNKVKHLQDVLGVSPIVCKLLVLRGIETFDEAKAFFRPTLEQLHDPFLMKDMDKAIDRITTAIQNEERILIYGDYDVDGTTSVSLMYSFLKEFYPNLEYYIPDRYKEGYGISFQGIDWAKDNDCTLIIALDCGIRAVDKVAYATEKGIDFIICDHHLPAEELPKAVAVLDPKRNDCEYPYKELSGCGIGFKLAQAFAITNDIPFENISSLLDLVAISIGADIVPMTGENRILAYYGLQQLNLNPRKGIQALKEVAGAKSTLTIGDVVFKLAPRINAAGRIADAKSAVKLLIGEDGTDNANLLNDNNNERKVIEKDITEEAISLVEEQADYQNLKSTVVSSSNWHKGVIGIVASRLIESHYKPTIVLAKNNGVATGSARSVKGFDVYNAINQCADLLDNFGGHKYAAGLTIQTDKISAFKQRFEEAVANTIKKEQLIPEVRIDAELELQDANMSLYNILKQFAPFGPGNMRPVFLTKQVQESYSKIVGENHLQLAVKQGTLTPIKGIGFKMAEQKTAINGKTFDVCYNLELNEWQGMQSLQLQYKDIKV